MKNFKIGIIFLGVIITVGILLLISNQEQINDNQIFNAINDELVSQQLSGDFQIDKTQYNIGEKIFLDMDYMSFEDKGTILVLRPINDTHRATYLAIPFDGANNNSYSYYFEPELIESKGICSIEDLIGKWSIVFYETNYSNIEFEIKNQISDWDDRTFEPVC